MKSLIFSLLLLSFSVQSVHAQGAQGNSLFTKVEETSLKLLGKGIRDKKTGAALTLACVGTESDGIEGCNQLRWVLSTDGESYFLGEVISPRAATESELNGEGLPSGEYQTELKAYLKTISKGAKKLRRNAWIALGTAGGVAGTLTLIASAGLTDGMIYAFAGGWFLLVPSLGMMSAGGNVFDGRATLKAQNNKGWNWADDAKPLNHNYFKYIFWLAGNLKVYGGWPSFEKPYLLSKNELKSRYGGKQNSRKLSPDEALFLKLKLY